MISLFISGSDTGVGKTLVSSLLLAFAIKYHKTASYYKPMQTGYLIDSDKDTVLSLLAHQGKDIVIDHGLTFSKPLSPHLAAYYDNAIIDISKLKEQSLLSLTKDINLIEGAGGLLVPIQGSYLMINFIKDLSLPCVLVARSTLGTINHTLLSLEALKLRHIPVFGIVMVGHYNQDNEASIRRYGKVNNILSIPFIPKLDFLSLASMVEDRFNDIALFLGYMSI